MAHALFVECVSVFVLSHFWFFVTPWTVALQAPLSMKFSRQEYWSGLPFPPSGDLPDPGIELICLLCLLHLASGFFTTRTTWEVCGVCVSLNKSTSYLSCCLWLNPFCDKTSGTSNSPGALGGERGTRGWQGGEEEGQFGTLFSRSWKPPHSPPG